MQQLQQLHTQPIGRMQAHVWTFAPSDSAYSRAVCRAIMAAIMRLSNIAMAYVHINCGEWRRLLHHVAPCSLQKTHSNRAIKRENNTAARSHDILNIHISLYGVSKHKKSESCGAGKCSLQRGRTMLEAHKVWVTCSSTRGLNIYLFVTQCSLSL